MARGLRCVSLPVDWAGPSHLYNLNDSVPCCHSDTFPDAHGECNIRPNLAWHWMKFCKAFVSVKAFGGFLDMSIVSPPKKQNCKQLRT